MKVVTPDAWGQRLSEPPILDVDGVGQHSGRLRRWTGTAATMSQPPLDHHYIVLHLGGAKRVTRTGEGQRSVSDVPDRAITVVPAGTRFEWRTEGPIDFAHLYIHPARLNHAVSAHYDRDPQAVTLLDHVGASDPLISQLICTMLSASGQGPDDAPFLDALFDCALAALVRSHTSLGPPRSTGPRTLAPGRLRRVLDFMEHALAQPITLDVLADLAGLSRYHFHRAFRQSMGTPPLAYLAQRRIEAARRLLADTDTPLHIVASLTGHASPSHFAERFRRHVGMTPSQYRRQP